MKYCPNCHLTYDDSANICAQCGVNLEPIPTDAMQYATTDHTSEFAPEDISEHKIFAMACYILGLLGIVIAALCAKDSRYVAFHIRQSLKIEITAILLSIIAAVFFWTFIIPIAAAICALILLVINIIAFFQVCGGKAKEPAIISSFKFMK